MLIIERGRLLIRESTRYFAGRTELLKKFKTPVILMRTFNPVYPPPGMNLKLPDWQPDYFMKQIGGDCGDFGETFKSMEEIFTMNAVYLISLYLLRRK